MKARRRLSEIKKSDKWYYKMLLAKDALPGTPFDAQIECLMGCLNQLNYMRKDGRARPCFRETYLLPNGLDLEGLNAHSLQWFGEQMTQAIIEGNSKLFRDWAEAIDIVKNHKPQPDKLRLAVIRFCIPSTETFTMRSIIDHLCAAGFAKAGSPSRDYDDLRTQVRRICREAHIKLAGKSGRPRNGDTNK